MTTMNDIDKLSELIPKDTESVLLLSRYTNLDGNSTILPECLNIANDLRTKLPFMDIQQIYAEGSWLQMLDFDEVKRRVEESQERTLNIAQRKNDNPDRKASLLRNANAQASVIDSLYSPKKNVVVLVASHVRSDIQRWNDLVEWQQESPENRTIIEVSMSHARQMDENIPNVSYGVDPNLSQEKRESYAKKIKSITSLFTFYSIEFVRQIRTELGLGDYSTELLAQYKGMRVSPQETDLNFWKSEATEDIELQNKILKIYREYIKNDDSINPYQQVDNALRIIEISQLNSHITIENEDVAIIKKIMDDNGESLESGENMIGIAGYVVRIKSRVSEQSFQHPAIQDLVQKILNSQYTGDQKDLWNNLLQNLQQKKIEN